MPRKRKDTTEVQTAIISSAMRGLQPPKHIKLDKGVMPFWEGIIATRLEWTDVDLIHAANFARVQHHMEKIHHDLKTEGDVIENRKGTPIMNPKHYLHESLTRRSIVLSRLLQVHAAATIGESKLSRGKNTAKRDAIRDVKELDDEDLIARPHVH